MIRKLLFVIYNNFIWTRMNPWLINPCRMTFISLKKFIINFVKNYVKKWDKILDFWCWNMVYKDLFLNK